MKHTLSLSTDWCMDFDPVDFSKLYEDAVRLAKSYFGEETMGSVDIAVHTNQTITNKNEMHTYTTITYDDGINDNIPGTRAIKIPSF